MSSLDLSKMTLVQRPPVPRNICVQLQMYEQSMILPSNQKLLNEIMNLRMF